MSSKPNCEKRGAEWARKSEFVMTRTVRFCYVDDQAKLQ